VNITGQGSVDASSGVISVLIADDHKLLAESLELYLKSDGGFLPDRAESLDEAIEKIAAKGTYDVVLLDLDMPGMCGLGGLERAIEANKGGRVVLFSGKARQEAALRAIELGASGFMPKTLSPKLLATALRFVAAGEVYFPSTLVRGRGRAEPQQAEVQLSSREHQVLRGICDGQTNKDIAQELNLTEVTVKMYVRSVFTKLKATNRTQAAIIGLSTGMV
jgi:DNA-binding NarL/FixJ family response regulator